MNTTQFRPLLMEYTNVLFPLLDQISADVKQYLETRAGTKPDDGLPSLGPNATGDDKIRHVESAMRIISENNDALNALAQTLVGRVQSIRAMKAHAIGLEKLLEPTINL